MNQLTFGIILKAVDQLTRPMRQAGRETSRTGKTAEQAQRQLSRLQRTAGSSQAFGRMEKQIHRVNRALQDQAYRMRVIDRLQKKVDANQKAIADTRSKLTGTAAGAVAVAAPAIYAAQIEEEELYLRTVINAANRDAALQRARATSRLLAQSGFGSVGEGLQIQYALNSAGLTADASAAATPLVAQVAKITRGVPEQVAEILAGTFSNMGALMEGTDPEKLLRIAELLTKTQYKFQLRDFGQLGDGLSYAAASAAGAKIPIEQVATVIGTLNSSQVMGSRAGTAFAAVERNLTKASKELGFEIVRLSNGQMDFIATLGEIEGALAAYDTLDERNDAIQKLFGDEGKAGLIPLLQKLGQMTSDLEDVSKGSAGIIREMSKLFSDSTKGNFREFIGSLATLGDSFGRAVLPGINAVLGPLAAFLGRVAELIERNPELAAVIGYVAITLVGLRLAFLAARLSMLLFHGGLLKTSLGLLKLAAGSRLAGRIMSVAFAAGGRLISFLAAGLLSLGRIVIPVAIGAVRALTIAIAANPIGAFVTLLTIAAVAIVTNWESVKEFFLRIWEPVKPYWESFAKWVLKIWDKISAPVSAIRDLFGSGKAVVAETAARAAAPAKQAAAALAVSAGVAAAPTASAGSATASAAQTEARQVNQSVQITIQAAPGQNADEIARQVQKALERQQRGALHD